MKILKQAEKKTYQRDAALTHTVMDIIENVQTNGDKALIEYAAKFDHMDIDTVRISPEQVKAAYEQVDEETIETIRFAAGQIRFFAEKQRECLKDLNIPSRVEGVEIGHRMIPVDRCGCYVPAGRHPLPSSALMGIVTAKAAGVQEVCACSPAYAGYGTIHPAVLVAMDIAGADEIYCMGGAQAVAAFAYGTQSIKKVDLIVGPGNKFVTEAKRQVLGDVGIDSLAGPSEVLIVADHTADPEFLAIDLLAQAEHDPNSKAILVCTDRATIDKTMKEMDRLITTLNTEDVCRQSWQDNGAIYLADSMQEAIDLANEIAPEHLEIETDNEREVAQQMRHYGSLFVGHYAPVAFGDFVSGPNHTLPTMGTARYSNGVWVGTFIKTPFHQFVNKQGCLNLAQPTMNFANIEGLPAHRDSVRLRVERLK
ncbi:histidinol dehydrogenase [Butyricicoccus intestinisimiae]|jgi:sulfopropanediol 3-dehydrogenase|uniref:histidinol dehydrogenase n=1 Tax=Butyricicoccus intestinisimiae TaxID=2841509 RepID=UPI003D9319A1